MKVSLLICSFIFLLFGCNSTKRQQEEISKEFLKYTFDSNCEKAWNICSDELKSTAQYNQFKTLICDSFKACSAIYGKNLSLIFKGTQYNTELGKVNFYRYKFDADTARQPNILFTISFDEKTPEKIRLIDYKKARE